MIFVGIALLILAFGCGILLARDGNNTEWWPGLMFLALFGMVLVIAGLQ